LTPVNNTIVFVSVGTYGGEIIELKASFVKSTSSSISSSSSSSSSIDDSNTKLQNIN